MCILIGAPVSSRQVDRINNFGFENLMLCSFDCTGQMYRIKFSFDFEKGYTARNPQRCIVFLNKHSSMIAAIFQTFVLNENVGDTFGKHMIGFSANRLYYTWYAFLYSRQVRRINNFGFENIMPSLDYAALSARVLSQMYRIKFSFDFENGYTKCLQLDSQDQIQF